MYAVRVYPELRAAHVERTADSSPAEVWYLATNDLRAEEVPSHFRRVGVLGGAFRLLRAPARVVEVPEPLWARFLPADLLLVLAARLGAALWRRDVRVCAYALENNDPTAALLGRPARGPLRSLVTRTLGPLVGRLFDRIAFGSAGAERSYAALPGLLTGVEVRTFGELPAPSGSPAAAEPGSVVFVGALERRKGLPELLRAWAEVERADADARLTIVGSGPLAPAVRAWVAERPQRRRFAGRLDHAAVVAVVGRAAVVVAPSVRDGRWREQIGLPIKEGLAAGATIVTTSETGLAGWLRDAGHHVLDPSTLGSALAPAVLRALADPLPRSVVRGSLPAEDGRIAADRWLHGT